jgi:hypothetical protein
VASRFFYEQALHRKKNALLGGFSGHQGEFSMPATLAGHLAVARSHDLLIALW